MNYIELKNVHNEYENVSLTGYRIIHIFKMLLNKPCDENEINEELKKLTPAFKKLSKDTISIYINTLRTIGCEIQRPSAKTNYKYIIKSHPFSLKLSEKEINGLISIKKNISTINNWKLMIDIDKLFMSLYKNLSPDSQKTLKNIDLNRIFLNLQNTSIEIIKELEKHCINKRNINIRYQSPDSIEKNIEVIADKIFYENNSLYLWCYNNKLEQTQYLRIDRIKKIETVNINKTNIPENKTIKVQYKLKNLSALLYTLEDNEKIIKQEEHSILIEASISNKFKFIQKVLSQGNNCVVISPAHIKKDVILKFKAMLNVYKK